MILPFTNCVVCVHVCMMLVCVIGVHVCVCEVCMEHCVDIERQFQVLALTFRHILRQGLVVVHHCTCLATWPTGFQVFSSL